VFRVEQQVQGNARVLAHLDPGVKKVSDTFFTLR
jgi:hypothetical protein